LDELVTHELVSAVFRAMRRRLWDDPELAADATQELFASVTRAFGRFDPTIGSFGGWVYGFVDRTARRARERAQRRAVPVERVPEAAIPDELSEAIDEGLRAAINELPERDRRLLILFGVEGWPASAVADELGMTPSNVTTRFARLRARLLRHCRPMETSP
jgi:RNA polymerase sigma-70 factor (ECF subfamily)